jgi:hypothetical protein
MGGELAGQYGLVTRCDLIVSSLLKQADGNIAKFTELLEENGYTVETYSNGEGPTYAEVRKQMDIDLGMEFGMEYS